MHGRYKGRAGIDRKRDHNQMLRIQDDSADAVKASLEMAASCLKAGRYGAAQTAVETAKAILDKDLEPSRATRGQARPEAKRVRTAPTKPVRTGSQATSRGGPQH